jgi:hypothetical protein
VPKRSGGSSFLQVFIDMFHPHALYSGVLDLNKSISAFILPEAGG